MRPIAYSCAAGLVALLLVSCGTSRPASLSRNGGTDTLAAFADSIEIAAYDDVFVEKHARVIAEIAKREEEGGLEVRVIEARALVDASEELYLMGRTIAAIKLLDEAERMLKQDN